MWARLSASWGRLGITLGVPGSVWERLRTTVANMAANFSLRGVLGVPWVRLGAVLGSSWGVLGASWAHLNTSWRVLGASCHVLGASWGCLLAILYDLGPILSETLEIHKNLVKPMVFYGFSKVAGAILAPSWLKKPSWELS